MRAGLARHGAAAELVIIRTSGDRDRQSSLREIGGKGVFTKELEDALLEERIDLAVHSMKDVPTALPPGLEIAAICEREDLRDALISRGGLKLDELPRGARVGTSSLRRQAQLRHHRADLVMVEMRGNVDTRLAKLAQGDYDAIVLAKAGLERLGRADQISELLPPSICLPAAGQGAVGIEMRAGDEFYGRRSEVESSGVAGRRGSGARRARRPRERLPGAAGSMGSRRIGRRIARRIGGLKLDACVLSVDGAEALRETCVGSWENPRELGALAAAALIERGAGRLLRLMGRGVEHG